MLRTKDKKLKSVAATSGVSAMLGITEPAMFGVNLKLKYPFYGAMLGAALGGGYVTLMNVLNTAPGAAGIVGFVCVPPSSMVHFLIGAAISILGGFGFTYLMSNMKRFNPELEDEAEEVPVSVPSGFACKPGMVYAPVAGTVIPSEEIPDETFAAGVLGRGVGIQPADGFVVAPFDGEISSVTDTHHAVGVTSPDGMELLIHVGVDTVSMNGDGFTCFVQEGQKVKAGDRLITFDRTKIAAAGHPDVVVVLVTNSDDYDSLTIQPGVCKALDKVIQV